MRQCLLLVACAMILMFCAGAALSNTADGTWEEWSKYVLRTLDDIRGSIEKGDVMNEDDHKEILMKIDNIDRAVNDHFVLNANQITELKSRSGLFGALGGVGSYFLTLSGAYVITNRNGKNGKNGKVVK